MLQIPEIVLKNPSLDGVQNIPMFDVGGYFSYDIIWTTNVNPCEILILRRSYNMAFTCYWEVGAALNDT